MRESEIEKQVRKYLEDDGWTVMNEVMRPGEHG